MVTDDWKCEMEINIRTGMATFQQNEKHSYVETYSTTEDENHKMLCVYSRLLCGVETWPLNMTRGFFLKCYLNSVCYVSSSTH